MVSFRPERARDFGVRAALSAAHAPAQRRNLSSASCQAILSHEERALHLPDGSQATSLCSAAFQAAFLIFANRTQMRPAKSRVGSYETCARNGVGVVAADPIFGRAGLGFIGGPQQKATSAAGKLVAQVKGATTSSARKFAADTPALR
jgi:hypothetical protein